MAMSPSCHLPENVMADILSRLPVKSLLRYRSVSKPWYALLTSPNFIKTTLRRANSDKLLTFSQRCNVRAYSVSYRSRDFTRSLSVYCRDDDVPLNIPLALFPFISTDSVKIVGSCNGLVCVHGTIGGPAMVLWNPATRQFRYIELHADCKCLSYSIFVGFGFLPDTDDYKVVEFQFPSKNWFSGLNVMTPVVNAITPPIVNVITIPLLVYTLSSDSWKLTQVAVPDAHFSETAIAMNGILHWMASVSNKLEIIVSFDLRDEAIQQITVPDSCGFGNDIKRKLVVLKGSLSVIVYSTFQQMDRCFEIWVMTEYGVQESWNKLFTVAPFSSVVAPVGSWRNGEVIFRYLNSEQLFSFDSSILKTQYFQVPGTVDLTEAFNYVESLESVEGGEKRSSRGCSFMSGYLGIQMPSGKAGDAETSSNDTGWKFAIPVPNNSNRLHCRLCVRLLYGGITQLKQHLAHQRGVLPCPYVSNDIREQMMKDVQVSEEKQIMERKQRKELRFSLPDDDFDDFDDSSDDSDVEMTAVKQDSAKLQRELEERIERHRFEALPGDRYDVGGSSGVCVSDRKAGDVQRKWIVSPEAELPEMDPDLEQSKSSEQPKISASVTKTLRKNMGRLLSQGKVLVSCLHTKSHAG